VTALIGGSGSGPWCSHGQLIVAAASLVRPFAVPASRSSRTPASTRARRPVAAMHLVDVDAMLAAAPATTPLVPGVTATSTTPLTWLPRINLPPARWTSRERHPWSSRPFPLRLVERPHGGRPARPAGLPALATAATTPFAADADADADAAYSYLAAQHRDASWSPDTSDWTCSWRSGACVVKAQSPIPLDRPAIELFPLGRWSPTRPRRSQ